MIKSLPFSRTKLIHHLASYAGATLLLVMAVTTAQADWPDNNLNTEKWIQGPDPYNGFDVLVGQGPQTAFPPVILANDFQCFKTGPITDIHLWTSWLGLDVATTIPSIPITLGIWSDVPATNGPGGIVTPSHPGTLLWTNTFLPGQYKVRPSLTANERFLDPDPAPGVILGNDFQIWQYNFYPPAVNTFTQTGSLTAPVTYWLSMTVSNLQATGAPKFFGWKTSTNVVLDNAVFGHFNAAGDVTDWQELIDPTSPVQRSLDLSFILTTSEIITNPPPPPIFTNKWVQLPDTNGFDINATYPFIAADDFQCTNSSPITNVQIWASFQNDLPPDSTTRFMLGIWSDVKKFPSVTGANGGYSHPGRLLCSNIFEPNEYTFEPAGTGQEFFYDPATGQITPEHQIWLYNFNLKNQCCQQGSTNSPMTYWLSVQAISSAGTIIPFGWKTSTNHWGGGDDAVFGRPDATGNITWQELFDPIQTSAKVSLDLAFVVNNGPPNPECEPNLHCKWKEAPDTTTNGMDVLATATNVLGDDYLCVKPGLISGITIFGSWLNDIVDTNAVFQLSLWSDVQGVLGTPTNYSHPGQPLCTTIFNPPQTVGRWLDRYQYSLYKDKVSESFFSPDLGASGFLGNDTKIWRYDFYPNQFGLSCWRQFGSTFNQGTTYWIVLSYLRPAGTTAQFGWKTAIQHLKDDAVYGHLDANNTPLGDWKDLHDPRSSTNPSKDLSFKVCDFPITSKNADLVNSTGVAVDGIQVVIPGQKIITAHYDDFPTWIFQPPVWDGGNTILQWSGRTIPVNGTTHIGWEYAGAGVKCLSINWTIGNVVIQPPIAEVNFVGLNNIGSLVLLNDIAQVPLGVGSGMVEFHSDAVSLDQMNPNGNRQDTLLATAPLQPPTDKMMPGGAMLLPMPIMPPPGARYAMFMINLTDPTTDFILLPLDAALQPVIDSVSLAGSSINLTFSSAAGRVYRVQYKTDLSGSGWTDSALGDIPADSAETSATVPLSGAQTFYRVELLPQ